MTNSYSPLIHVGLMKCGSSFLQDKIFNDTFGYCVVDKVGDKSAIGITIQATPILNLDACSIKEKIDPELKKYTKQGLVPVMSSEGFTGNTHSGSFNAKENADKLNKIFPNAKILLVIREQQKMIHSAYQQYIKQGGIKRLCNYLNPIKDEWFKEFNCKEFPHFNLKQFEYHHLIQYYQQLFGQSNVLVLPMEYLSNDPKNFINSILKFSGCSTIEKLPDHLFEKTNESLPAAFLSIQRWLNIKLVQSEYFSEPFVGDAGMKYKYKLVKWGKRIKRYKVIPNGFNKRVYAKRERKIRDHCKGQFEKSNHKTSELIGFDLKSLGYE